MKRDNKLKSFKSNIRHHKKNYIRKNKNEVDWKIKDTNKNNE